MTCQRVDCGKTEDLYYAKISVYADQTLYPNTPPMTMIIGAATCKSCTEGLDPSMFITSGAKELLARTALIGRKVQPDFSTIKAEWISVDSSEAREFRRSLQAGMH